MTQATGHPELFTIGADGGFVLHDAEPAPVTVAEAAVDLQAEWGGGAFLDQGDRAMIQVLPDSVEVGKRAGHLINALDSISEANKAAGFSKAVASPDHRPAIDARYGAHTEGVEEGLAYKGLTGERRAQYEFFAASGVGRLAVATELSPDERVARRVMLERWKAFQGEYGATGPRAVRKRNAFKAVLRGQLDYTRERAETA